MYPEEAIDELERLLIGKRIEKKILTREIEDFFLENKVTPYGISSEAIVEGIMMCLD